MNHLMSWKRLALAGAAMLALASCSSSTTTVPSANVKPAAAIVYTAVGASDAVGYGASVPCANPPVIAVPTCPGGTGYVPDIANALGATQSVLLDDLGISGAVIGPDIRALGNEYGSLGSAAPCVARTGGDVIPSDFITGEAPFLSGHENLITVFAGGNDTNALVNAIGCGAGGTTLNSQELFISQWVQNFGLDYEQLIALLHSRAPHAKIVIANLPNFAVIPIGAAQPPAVQGALAAVSVSMDQYVINQFVGQGIPVVDLLCNPAVYNPADFYTDGFHPNDAGYALLASLYLAQIAASTPTPPSASCPYSAASALRAPLTQAIPTFNLRH